MDWPSYLKVKNVDAFFGAMNAVVSASTDWILPETGDCGADRCFTAGYVGDGFVGNGLFLALSSFDEEPCRIQLTMHATRWGNDRVTASADEYAQAERLAAPLLEAAGKILRRKLRLLRPQNKPQPLRGELARSFEGFLHSATDLWTGAKLHVLHGSDRMRFWRFVRMAHQYSSTLRPGDVSFHLTRAGFDGGLISKLTDEYVIGRQILAMHPYPWELRVERKRARERRRKADAAEYERVFGHPKPGEVPEA
jgi:hypothetical protein